MISAAFPIVGRAMETALMLQKFWTDPSTEKHDIKKSFFFFSFKWAFTNNADNAKENPFTRLENRIVA